MQQSSIITPAQPQTSTSTLQTRTIVTPAQPQQSTSNLQQWSITAQWQASNSTLTVSTGQLQSQTGGGSNPWVNVVSCTWKTNGNQSGRVACRYVWSLQRDGRLHAGGRRHAYQ